MMFSRAATLDRLVWSFNPFQFRLFFCVYHQDLFLLIPPAVHPPLIGTQNMIAAPRMSMMPGD
jgi:hypothetical protein